MCVAYCRDVCSTPGCSRRNLNSNPAKHCTYSIEPGIEYGNLGTKRVLKNFKHIFKLQAENIFYYYYVCVHFFQCIQ